MINIQVNTAGISQISERLNNLGLQLSNLEPLHLEIANEILNITEQSFHDQKSPSGKTWKPKSATTRSNSNKTLINEGYLEKSFTTHATNDRAARVSTNLMYAAIHQFGGKTGKGHKVQMPARPFFPVDNQGNLDDVAIDAVVAKIEEFIRAGL